MNSVTPAPTPTPAGCQAFGDGCGPGTFEGKPLGTCCGPNLGNCKENGCFCAIEDKTTQQGVCVLTPAPTPTPAGCQAFGDGCGPGTFEGKPLGTCCGPNLGNCKENGCACAIEDKTTQQGVCTY